MEDFEELLSSLTPRTNTDSIGIYQNTVGLTCPSCDQPFDDLIVCRDEYNELNLDYALDICTTTHEGDPVLFTHKP